MGDGELVVALRTRGLPGGCHGGLNTEMEEERRCFPMSLVETGTHASRAKISLITAYFLRISSALPGGTIGICQNGSI